MLNENYINDEGEVVSKKDIYDLYEKLIEDGNEVALSYTVATHKYTLGYSSTTSYNPTLLTFTAI